MEEAERHVREWALEHYSKEPQEVILWHSDNELIECIVRFSQSISIAVLVGDADNWIDEQLMSIQASEWTPGAIQANRRPDGSIRIRFQRRRVDFSAVMKSPHSISALIEEWLMKINGGGVRPRDRTRRIAALKRESEAVRRMFDQASLSRISEDVEKISTKLDGIETNLEGRSASKADE
ncbi:MAG: hypothetical protein CXT69_05205 [Methanobacteriota archaeon]|jgi:hypothetical protein|nr:MAG: hypothetical protein CXT69_05205 [Euryarchaeota archaeon]HIK78738.1 hypothetical protein [Candidatus Poseidoniales archaeon]